MAARFQVPPLVAAAVESQQASSRGLQHSEAQGLELAAMKFLGVAETHQEPPPPLPLQGISWPSTTVMRVPVVFFSYCGGMPADLLRSQAGPVVRSLVATLKGPYGVLTVRVAAAVESIGIDSVIEWDKLTLVAK